MDTLKLLVLVVDLCLLGSYGLSLCALVLGILAHEAQAPVHLHQILGREDKHDLVLHRAVTGQIAHGLDVLGLAALELSLKGMELRLENTDIAFDMMDIFLYVLDILLALVNLSVDHHQVLQSGSHVGLVLFKSLLLLTDLLLYGRTLALQPADLGIGIDSRLRAALFRASALLRGRRAFGLLRRGFALLCRGGLFGRALAGLRTRGCGKQQSR